MKKVSPAIRLTLFILALCAGASAARGGQGEVPYDFFYGALQSSGTWLESADYGYVWQPRVAVEKSDWRPYSEGCWAQTDQGWTWVSYEDFGWATYHYGRWARLADTGWIWVPGFEWAPAWVSWRASPTLTGRNLPSATRPPPDAVAVEPELVVGWAPLPPEAAFDFARGFSPQVDLAFQIGPDHYNFVPARYFGELALQPWILRSSANEGFIGSTRNCTNIIYRPNPGFIWSGGPSLWALRAVVQNPIAQLRLESQFVATTTQRSDFANRLETDLLVVTAPIITPPKGKLAGSVGLPVGPDTIEPPLGGTVIPAKPIDHGWTKTQRDSATAAQLREQIKRQAADASQLPILPSGFIAPADPIRVAGPKSIEASRSSATTAIVRRRANKARSGVSSQPPHPAATSKPGKSKTHSGTLPQPAAGDAPANAPASPRPASAK